MLLLSELAVKLISVGFIKSFIGPLLILSVINNKSRRKERNASNIDHFLKEKRLLFKKKVQLDMHFSKLSQRPFGLGKTSLKKSSLSDGKVSKIR